MVQVVHAYLKRAYWTRVGTISPNRAGKLLRPFEIMQARVPVTRLATGLSFEPRRTEKMYRKDLKVT
jgi:hypothetical protein